MMWIAVVLAGAAGGYLINKTVNTYSLKLSVNSKIYNQWMDSKIHIGITMLLFLISYLRFGFTHTFLQAMVLNCIMITVTTIDIRHRLIPNKLVLIILASGIIFLALGSISFMDAFLGIMVGGGLLYIFSLIPKAMGGGDVKFMFAVGTYLGLKGSVLALMIGFLSASLISIFLLALRIIGRKDHIPFGPFLALGSLIAFHFII